MQVTRLIHFGHIMAPGRNIHGLTPKQERFCVEYVKDHNATQAAIRAGYAKNSANEQGSRLLANASLRARVEALDVKVQEKALITAAEVIEGLKRIANFDPRKVLNDRGEIKPPQEWPDEFALAVQGFEVEDIHEWDPVTKTKNVIGRKTKFKQEDRKGAWNLLGKHLKLWSDTTVNVNLSLEDLVNKSYEGMEPPK